MWNEVTSEADIKRLMEAFGYFHDGCIREMHLWGGYSVGDNLSMHCPETPDLRCRLLIQRQWKDPAAIELLFDGVSHCSVAAEAGYDRIIMEATLLLEPGRIVWSPDEEFHESEFEPGASSAIVAKRLWWREIESGLGSALRYSQLPDPPPGFMP